MKFHSQTGLLASTHLLLSEMSYSTTPHTVHKLYETGHSKVYKKCPSKMGPQVKSKVT